MRNQDEGFIQLQKHNLCYTSGVMRTMIFMLLF